MFHVEPEFYHAWQYYSRALKQRNSLLKSKRFLSLSDLEAWNQMLSEYGEILHSQRVGIMEQWKPFLRMISNIYYRIWRFLWNTVPAFTVNMAC